MSQSEFRYIVRIAGRDLDGTRKIPQALAEIRGVGIALATRLVNALRFDPRLRLGALSEAQLGQLESALRDLRRSDIPAWALNRRKDLETGSDLHLIGADWDLMVKTDVDREKAVSSWRGVRHSLGLKVRGQRTRTSGRTGRTIGVRKAAVQAAAAAAAAAAKEEKK